MRLPEIASAALSWLIDQTKQQAPMRRAAFLLHRGRD
jgi:hypothetical protein